MINFFWSDLLEITGHILLLSAGFLAIFTIIFIEMHIMGARWIALFFTIFFLVIAPIIERIHEIAHYGGEIPSVESYFFGAIVIFSFVLLISISCLIYPSSKVIPESLRESVATINIQTDKVIIAILFFLSVIYLYLVDWNLSFLIIREPLLETETLGISLLVADRFIRLLIATIVFLTFFSRVRGLTKTFAMIFMVFTCFPTSLPRFLIFFYYGPFCIFLLYLLINKYKYKHIFINFILIFIIIFLFVIFNIFRNSSTITNVNLFSEFSDFFIAGHTDSFSSLQHVFDLGEVTYGQQLLGAVLFFIPRSIWAEKPTGTGGWLAEKYNFDWNNVSANYFAEGFVNFGFIGVFMFLIIIIFTLIYIDRLKKISTRNLLFYFFLPGAMPIILRGDLINSLSVTMPLIVIAIAFNLFTKIEFNFKK